MLLKPKLETLDGLPEELHENYVKDGDFFVLTHLQGLVSSDKFESDTANLQKALSTEREANGKLKGEKRTLEERLGGIDPDEYTRLQQAESDRNEADSLKKGEYDSLKQQLIERHQQDMAAKDEEIASMQKSLEVHMIDAEAERACAKLEGSSTLLMPHIKQACKVVRTDDGKYVVRVNDASGNPRIDGDGKFMSIEDQVTEMRSQDTFAGVFKGTSQSGAGTPPGGETPSTPNGADANAGAAQMPPGDRAGWSVRDKVAAFRAAESAEEGSGVKALIGPG